MKTRVLVLLFSLPLFAQTPPVDTLKRFSYQIRMSVAEKLKLPPPLPMFNYAEFLDDEPVKS